MLATLSVFEALERSGLLYPLFSPPVVKTGRGRPRQYALEALLKALILKELLQVPSRRKLALLLSKYPYLRERCGLSAAPPHVHFSTLIGHLGREGFESLFYQFVRQLKELGVVQGRITAVDSTLVPAYSRPKPEHKPSDPDAGWGVRTKGDWVFGYKIHLACDTETELPLAFIVTSGSVADGKILPLLVNRLTGEGFKPRFLVADAGYDSMENRRLLASHGIVAVIARNPRRHSEPFQPPSPEWQAIYRQRVAAERVNSRLKEELGLKLIKVRGQWRVEVHVALALITMLAVALTAALNGKRELATSLSSFRFQ